MNLFPEEYWLNAHNLGKPKAGYSGLARIKQWCGNYSELIAPKEIANFASAFALLTMPEPTQNNTAIVFGCVSEDTASKLRMEFDKLLLICSSKNLPSNSYIYDSILELPFSGRKALTQWLAELAKQV